MSNVAINFKTFRQSYYVFVEKHSLLIWLSEKKLKNEREGAKLTGKLWQALNVFIPNFEISDWITKRELSQAVLTDNCGF